MTTEFHFVLIPYLSPGHHIPMVDIARILAQRGIAVTVITTPVNAAKFRTSIDRAAKSGLPINLMEIPFPGPEFGLPEGCESFEAIPSRDLYRNFFVAIRMLQQPLEKLISGLKPSPNCLIADKALPWTADIAAKFRIPRLVFDGTSCFNLLCSHNLHVSKVYETASEFEPFVVPGLPDHIELTSAQLPAFFNPRAYADMKDIRQSIREAEGKAYGVLINSFEELEPNYLEKYRKAKGEKSWCVGPVSLCNVEDSDKAHRGNKSSTDENQCLKWLDSQATGSVIYACLGSLNRLTPPQMIELGLALEDSNRPFIWVIRGGYKKDEMEEWLLETRFEGRVKGRGLLVRGWAPQVLILSHPAIGGFLTHCGWNSTLEGISAGVPMITWPLFAEQFLNEKLVVQVLDIGAWVGAKVVVHLGEEENFGVLVRKENIREAIDRVMSDGKEGEERRERARKLGKMAKKAVEEGGSSYLNIALLIEDIKHYSKCNRSETEDSPELFETIPNYHQNYQLV